MAFSDFKRGDRGRERADRDRDQGWGRDRGEHRAYGSQEHAPQDSDLEGRGWRQGSDYYGDRSERYGAGAYGERSYSEGSYGGSDYDNPRRYSGGRDDWREDQGGDYGGRNFGSSGRQSFNDRWQESYGRGGGSGTSYGQRSGEGYRQNEGPSYRPNYGQGNFGESNREGYGGLYGRQGYGGSQYGSSSSRYRNEFESPGYAGRMSELESGPHRGRGPRGYRRSDDRIREDACECLTHDAWIDASNIDVTVKDCEVTLSGTVASREEKRRAEDLIERLSGVKDVNNTLRVADERGQSDNMTQGKQSASSTQSSSTQSTTAQSGQPGQTGQTGQTPRH